MSSSFHLADIMASTEDIEAKLCAYVDGELDEAAQAEIERHLADNPQHRELITDLVQHRDMIRALPRVRAPQDISETLGAQLERAVLLGDDEAGDTPILRISHWPQIRAAAAILLLVFGLAAVVYYVLPTPDRAHSELTAVIEPADEPVAAIPVSPSDPVGFAGGGVVTVGRGEPDPDHHPSGVTLLALGDPSPALPHYSNVISPHDLLIGEGLDALVRPRAQLRVEVISPDPFATGKQVHEYLSARRIDFEPTSVQAPPPAPLMLDGSQTIYSSRLQQTSSHLKESNLGARADTDEDALSAPTTEPSASVAPPAAAKQTQPPLQFIARRMSRKDVDLMCTTMSDASLRQTAQVSRDAPQLYRQRQAESDSAQQRQSGLGIQNLHLTLTPPATQPMDDSAELFGAFSPAAPAVDEQVDVMIVVRDASGEASPTPPAVPLDEESPTTSPATSPASP